jgi:hypothetical protein
VRMCVCDNMNLTYSTTLYGPVEDVSPVLVVRSCFDSMVPLKTTALFTVLSMP